MIGPVLLIAYVVGLFIIEPPEAAVAVLLGLVAAGIAYGLREHIAQAVRASVYDSPLTPAVVRRRLARK